MWSNIYEYYELRLSLSYSATANTSKVLAILTVQAELKQNGLLMFRNAPEYPWIDLCVIKSANGNFHCGPDTWMDECNMIAIVCAKSQKGRIPDTQRAFLLHLAQMLGWYLVQDENEAGDENVVLWCPN